MRVGRPSNICIHGKRPRSQCVICIRNYQENYRRSLTADDHRLYRLKYRFNLTPDKVIGMLKKQKNRCGLCGAVLENFVIDHDHECCPDRKSCGKCVRGLLCVPCNAMLGQLSRIFRIGFKKVLKYARIVKCTT